MLAFGKGVSFVLSMLSLYAVFLVAFFEPGMTWSERFMKASLRLVVAASVSFASGLLFTLPGGGSLWKTLPVRVFLWTTLGMAVMFLVSWYVRCGGANTSGQKMDCY